MKMRVVNADSVPATQDPPAPRRATATRQIQKDRL